MVRFLVGTMLDVASGRRPADDVPRLLAADTNRDVSAPAPPHALYLEAVRYPAALYADDGPAVDSAAAPPARPAPADVQPAAAPAPISAAR
jgi:tRNA U38,U39,U40 pseudouridine synthase TruA